MATSGVEDPYTPGHIIIASDADRNLFLKLATYPNDAKERIRILELHLDAEEMDAYQEDKLAMALNEFHPRPDGTNPHNLDGVKIVVFGRTLFTRYNYHLVSPAVSYDVKGKLNQFLTNNLSSETKASLPYKINSTEKVLARALLGIRGVRQILVMDRGRLEAGFEETITQSLLLPPGAQEVKVSSVTVGGRYATPELDREGEFYSRGYDQAAQNPYPTHDYKLKTRTLGDKDEDSVLLDETTMLLGHFLNLDEDQARIEAAATAAKQHRRERRTFDEELGFLDELPQHGRGLRSNRTQQQGVSARNAGNRDTNLLPHLGLHNMVRLNAGHQVAEDLGFAKQDLSETNLNSFPHQGSRAALPKGLEHSWLVLTGKGNTVEMGWKI
ncbi:hypothetical protein BU26DRAFT_82319 [Trematosphaeria pertusa]|uniref:Uncharacterized protein n=1 Tax=Trematosphaeria pertusa TaxID=390896 RepID=A0A6A6I2A0_9PLEO|nr:uncharacterized protein BU26DRAFT_82319 [Trematosphaeria pertusa]KAF2244605.1 hypothetical protein BU26DRAFT_82319 [Trematosphaeria pertusa]